jgi:CRISPR/Cas system-associated endonuclease Cas1
MNRNMTSKELERLAMLVAKKVVKEINEFDDIDITTEEGLLGELAKYQTMLMFFEDKEEYLKAGAMLKKVRKILKKLDDEFEM